MGRRRIGGLSAIAAVVVVWLAGCNPQDAHNLAQDTRDLAQHAGVSLQDASVAGRVNAILALRKGVDMTGIHVDAKGSAVTISGHVRDQDERRRVRETALGIRGVDSVDIHSLRVGR